MFPKSAGPIRKAHSVCACQAARSSVHEIGPHSSELAVLFAKEKEMPCRTRIWQIVVTFYDEVYDDLYDILCHWNKETEIVIKCRKLS